MATWAQGGTIQIQSSSYGSLGHQAPPLTVHRDSHTNQKLSHHIPSLHAIAFPHFDLNRIIKFTLSSSTSSLPEGQEQLVPTLDPPYYAEERHLVILLERTLC